MIGFPRQFSPPPPWRRAPGVALILAGLGVGPSLGSASAQVAGLDGFRELDPTAATSGVRLVVDVRPAALARTLPMRAALTQLPHDAPSEIRALASGAIEQVLILAGDPAGPPPVDGKPKAPRVAVLLRANRPFDWRSFPSGRLTDVTRGPITYRRAEGGPGATCYRVFDDRTLLVAGEDEVTAPPLTPGAPDGPHVWDDAWRGLRPATIRLALDAAWLRERTRDLRQALDPAWSAKVAPLLDRPRDYTLTIGGPNPPALALIARCPDEAAAREVAACLDRLVGELREALPEIRRDLGGAITLARNPRLALLMAVAEGAIGSTRVEALGTTARLTAEVGGPRTAALATSLLISTVQEARAAARRLQSLNNLKRVGLGLLNYESVHGAFPPAVVIGADGRTPHSWRVAILPYLGEKEAAELFRAYKLDEPWDGPSNIKLVERMPDFYHDPGHQDAAPGIASYFVPTGPTTSFPPGRPRGLTVAEFRDGQSTTILAFEARRAIPWTKPEDIPIDPGGPLPALGGARPEGFGVLFADGSVRTLKASLAPKTLRAHLTPDGAEVIERNDD